MKAIFVSKIRQIDSKIYSLSASTIPPKKVVYLSLLHCRFVLHAGTEDGFLPNCELVFQSKTNDGRDYHSEMNGEIFRTWVNDQLLRALAPNSVVVMDNASYHSVQEPDSKAPTSATLKADMQQWLERKGVAFDKTLTKPKLYDIIKREKENIDKDYQIDNVLARNGHTVLRLPPYHCDMNPIELIWSNMKGYVAKKNHNLQSW